MKKTLKLVAIAIIRQNNKYLLTFRADKDLPGYTNCWQFPGGAVDFGETVEEALKREILEEIGIKIKIKSILPKIFYDFKSDHFQAILICFICEPLTQKPKIRLNKESRQFSWFSFSEALKLKKMPNENDMLEVIRNKRLI